MPLHERIAEHGDRVAIVDPSGRWTYRTLDADAAGVAGSLLAGADDLEEARVAILATPGHDYVTALLGAWRAGGIAVPFHPDHPDAELTYIVENAGVSAIVSSIVYRDRAHQLAGAHGLRVLTVGDLYELGRLPDIDDARGAMMLYTSGTTGKPKGVVHTHASLAAMIHGLVDAWAWSADDRILLVLPLHHVHGVVNVVSCSLQAGAVCEAPGSFDAANTWERFASGDLTLFMAVPTVYARLVTAWEAADVDTRQRWSDGATRLRLMVCGSAALPVSTLDRWRELTGQTLLERYGMTEIGMGLSNTLERRVPGHVGEPLPHVQVRVVGDDGADVPDGEPGELLVRGPQLFREYWNLPEVTDASFVTDAAGDRWFRTGDVTVRTPDGFRILGRSSTDIIKSGGEKISTLEIEETYRTHDVVRDCAVVGIPDDEWGEQVCAAVVVAPGTDVQTDALRAWGKERLAAAKVPRRFVVVDDLPRNAMGKVVKAEVVHLFPPSK